ncbi:MAG: rod shape-determining protein MreD [Acidobacteriota bacterium]|nr:rod shape-determining protein MreD [Acidobacteriota bacterium]
MKLKIVLSVTLAVLLQSTLRKVWPPLGHIDLPLIIVAYFALRRDPVQAVVIGTAAGLATDALSVGLLGAYGFSKTLTAYLIASLVTRIALDNPLLRIPVLASAAALDELVYVLLHRLFGQSLAAPFAETVAFKMIWTTVVGTFIFYAFDRFFSEQTSQRRQFAFRRRIARRSISRRR